MTSIGKKIRDARKNAGMTQVELAKATNLSRSYIGDIEKDRYNPSVSTLQAIAKATNVPVETLLGGAAPAPPAPQKSDGLPELNARDERDIERDLEDMLHSVAQADYKAPGDEEDTEALRAALRVAMIQAKRTAKKKYTPRKYRKGK
ncbi:MAG: helix-turn-helix transcriptional regulator [Selenomonas bovis]